VAFRVLRIDVAPRLAERHGGRSLQSIIRFAAQTRSCNPTSDESGTAKRRRNDRKMADRKMRSVGPALDDRRRWAHFSVSNFFVIPSAKWWNAMLGKGPTSSASRMFPLAAEQRAPH